MYLTITLIIVTTIISYRGFRNEFFLDRYSFRPQRVVKNREFLRFISSGFLHVSWMHLIINMLVLYAFGSGLELLLGSIALLFIYFISLIGGNVFALWIHKYNHQYNSVGASGAISGLVFATIAIRPHHSLFLGIPMWFVGLAYVALTVIAIRSQRRDVGHAAHLGGGLIGMLTILAIMPNLFVENWIYILAISLPAIGLIVIMIYRPNLILIDKRTQKKQLTYDDHYNISKADQKKEVDRILEKINEKGISSLTKKERELLDEYSRS